MLRRVFKRARPSAPVFRSFSAVYLSPQRSGPFLVSPASPDLASRAAEGGDAGPLLTAAIKNASTFAELEEIVRKNEAAPFFNGVHDAVVCSTLGRVVRRARQRLGVLESTEELPVAAARLCLARIAAWLKRSHPQGLGLGPREGASLLHSAATLTARGAPTAELARRLAQGAGTLDGHQAANCLWASSKLSLSKVPGGAQAAVVFAARVAALAGAEQPLAPEDSWKALWALNALGVAHRCKPETREALGRAAAQGWVAFFDAGGEEVRFFPGPAVGLGWRADAVKCFAAAGEMMLRDKRTLTTLASAAERALCGAGASAVASEQRARLAQKCASVAGALGMSAGAFSAVATGAAAHIGGDGGGAGAVA